MKDDWKVAEAVMPYASAVLLYGIPGTGKTFAGQRVGVKPGDAVYSLYLTEYTPVTEVRGTIYPILTNGEREFKWVDGPALMAYRNGGRLVINEINQCSDDCITFLLALLDNPESSKITLPSGEVIRPHKNFTVVATMNGEPGDLLPALRDRFPVTIRISKPHPNAVKALPEDLQKHAASTAVLEEERRVGIRQWMAFAALRDNVDPVVAMEACFGNQAEEILNAMTMSTERDYGYRETEDRRW